jgi:ribosomal protein S18 acetylase RimI-like enzyme
MVNPNVSIRRAVLNDQGRISNLIYFESHVHRHLDWRSPLDWLGADEYWVLEQGKNLVAALACPPDPPGICWMRLFAHSRSISAWEAWSALWQVAFQQVVSVERQTVAAITLQPWLGELLQQSGFELDQRIVVLEHDHPKSLPIPDSPVHIIRPMVSADLPAVAVLDASAFNPIWQNSQISLQMAFAQAGLATVIEEKGRLLGYQISTGNPFGMHLARLAVLPEFQGQGLGKALLQDLLHHAAQSGMQRITVNTQADNQPSLALYQKLGFRVTGEQYPTYVMLPAAS